MADPRRVVASIALATAGVIHLLPLIGLAGPTQLERLYGIPVDDANLDILLRHRAVLFGILGVFLIGSIRRPAWQVPVITAGLVSATSFVLITALVGGANEPIQNVVGVDLVAIVALAVALVLRPGGRTKPPETDD